jgi:hypothetical protein
MKFLMNLPQFLVRLCRCCNHHYACHHRFWVTDDCTPTEYFVVPFTVWSVFTVWSGLFYFAFVVSSCSSLVWTVNRSLLYNSNKSFVMCPTLPVIFELSATKQSSSYLVVWVGRRAGICPPPSFKKKGWWVGIWSRRHCASVTTLASVCMCTHIAPFIYPTSKPTDTLLL